MKRESNPVKGEVEIKKEDLIDVNRNWIRDESFLIDQFCIRHNLDVVKTNSGVRYCIYNLKKTNNLLGRNWSISE